MFEVSSFALGVSASFTSTALAQASINSLDNALDSLNNRRADTGTMINRIEHIINDNMAEVINVEASRSRIEDTDMAREIVDYTKSQLLNQTGIDTTRIANMSGQTALDLVGMTLQSVGSKVG
ncbi:MAG TPA: flagellin [bacterium]|nr:flagellin [bacterium]